MKRNWMIAGVVTLMLASATQAQSSLVSSLISAATNATAGSSGTSTSGTSTTATSVKQQLRGDFAQLVGTMLAAILDNLRTTLGVSSDATDAAGGLYSVFENALVNMVETSLTTSSSE